MTLEEACRLIDPATDLDALAEIEYYNGFKGKDAAAKALHEASQMVVDFVRQMSWHDAKNPPIAHEESWECAGEKHCAVMRLLSQRIPTENTFIITLSTTPLHWTAPENSGIFCCPGWRCSD